MNTIKNKIIIIGGNHRNSLGLIRSLGSLGYPITFLMEPSNLNFCYIRFSKYITTLYHLTSCNEIINVLYKNFWNEKNKPIILCGSDSSISLLDEHYEQLKNHFYIFNAANKEGYINYLLKKSNTFEIAEKCGFSLIKTWRIQNKNIPLDITYPCLIKGNISTKSSKSDMVICYNLEELASNLKNEGDYLIQEYIEKDFELNTVGFAYNHGNNIIAPATVVKIRDYMYRQSDYICLEDINKYSPYIKTYIADFIKRIGYEGIFSIETICKDNKFYFLEINLRNDGTSYLYTAAGVNYPLLWLQYCTGTLTDKIEGIKVKTPYTLIQISDFLNVLDNKVSLGKWIIQAFRSDAYFVFDIHDIKPFLYQIYIPFRQLIKKILRLK